MGKGLGSERFLSRADPTKYGVGPPFQPQIHVYRYPFSHGEFSIEILKRKEIVKKKVMSPR